MKLANLAGRAVLVGTDGGVDIARASGGRFGPDPLAVLADWDEFTAWTATNDSVQAAEPLLNAELGPVVPTPRQIFAIGLNYREHAEESGFAIPAEPVVFTKFASCLSGPVSTVPLPGASVDWEVELVAVIGRTARRVPVEQGWSAVAGLTVGQDLSERAVQFAGPAPQFSMAKSFPGFGPVGPVLVSPDEFEDPDDLELGCSLGDEVLQKGRTSDMVFGVAELVARLSATVELWPGDLIFTGTPAGVGNGRTPPRYLAGGDVLTSYVSGIGELRTTFVPAEASSTA